jgi:hypothetical protein
VLLLAALQKRVKVQVESQGSRAQTPFMHERLGAQALLQRPQWSGEVLVSWQRPEQRSVPVPLQMGGKAVEVVVDGVLVGGGVAVVVGGVAVVVGEGVEVAELEVFELDDVELDDVELDDIEFDGVGLSEVGLDDVELRDVEVVDVKLRDEDETVPVPVNVPSVFEVVVRVAVVVEEPLDEVTVGEVSHDAIVVVVDVNVNVSVSVKVWMY